MPVAVTMPKLGLTMREGTVVAWLRRAGERVRQGEPLLEIATDKIQSEVEAPASGTLLSVLVQAGQTVPCQATLAWIALEGEAGADAGPAAASPTGCSAATPARPTAAVTGAVAAPARRVPVSPAARKLADEAGVDLASLRGTGPSGRITREDVQRAIDARAAAPGRVAAGGGRVAPLTPMRRAIAARMVDSLREAAQLTLTTSVDATPLVEFRAALLRRYEARGVRPTFNDLVVRAAALALAAHPALNAAWSEAGIVEHAEVHVGIAVDVPGGLVVPVIRNADRLDVLALHRAAADLTERARAGRLTVDDLHGGTFTVSNLGAFGVDAFTPILNPPQSALLGVGALRAAPVVRGGAVVPGHVLTLSLTIDHRVVDGATGARYLAAVRSSLEEPARLDPEHPRGDGAPAPP